MNDIGKCYFVATKDGSDIITELNSIFSCMSNISEETYLNICKKYNGFKGFKGKYYFTNLDDIYNAIEELESYMIMEKLIN